MTVADRLSAEADLSSAYLMALAGGRVHAVAEPAAAASDAAAGPTVTWARASCGAGAVLVRKGGAFRRGNEWMDRRSSQLCPVCAWTVALSTSTVETELVAAVTPGGGELEALQRLVPDPLLTRRICDQVLADWRDGGDYDPDSGRWASLLGHVTAHHPVLLLPEDCSESACEHKGLQACYQEVGSVACPACSFQAGSWAGEWEGMYEAPVPAPCAVLPVLARHVGLPAEDHPAHLTADR